MMSSNTLIRKDDVLLLLEDMKSNAQKANECGGCEAELLQKVITAISTIPDAQPAKALHHDLAVLLSAYTGYLLTRDFGDVHAFIERTLDRPVFSHEMADEKVLEQIKAKLLPEITRLIEMEIRE